MITVLMRFLVELLNVPYMVSLSALRLRIRQKIGLVRYNSVCFKIPDYISAVKFTFTLTKEFTVQLLEGLLNATMSGVL